jgi:hypothetical protein
VIVAFRIFLGGDVYVGEDELRGRELDLSARTLLKGQVVMSAPGEPEATPEDELVPLVLKLCFGAVADLTRGDHAAFAYDNDYGYVRLDREGSRIRVSGDGLPVARFSEEELLPGLLDCGARFRAWAATVPVPGWTDAAVPYLEQAERDAREAFARHLAR